MTKKRFKKLLRARMIQHSQKNGYKVSYLFMRDAFSKKGKLADNYEKAWVAIDKALPL